MQFDLTALERAMREQASLNESYLDEFAAALVAGGIDGQEAERHLREARRFLNDYLLHEDDNSLEMGCYLADDYVEGYLVAQLPDTSPDDIVHSADSLVRFYASMLQAGHVTADDFEELEATVRMQTGAWQQEAAAVRGEARPDDSLLGSIQGTVAQSLAGVAPTAQPLADVAPTAQPLASVAPTARPEPIASQASEVARDTLALCLLYLCSQEPDAQASLLQSLVRLREAGLLEDGNPEALPMLTSLGAERAAEVLRSLGPWR